MIKQHPFTFRALNQDLSKAKYAEGLYYDASNIRIVTNESFGAITNQKGNEYIFTLDASLEGVNNLKYIHHEDIDDKVVIFATNETQDVIFLLDNDNVQVIYVGNFNFSYNSVLTSEAIYENQNVQKIYFSDGETGFWAINIAEDFSNKLVSQLEITPNVSFSTPLVIGYEAGGAHTAGMVQYAVSYGNLNGSETRASSSSFLVTLDGVNKGLPINQQSSKSPIVEINNIDQNFDYLKVYQIKYSSFNELPKISIIYETNIVTDTFKIVDDNNSFVREVGLNEFIFLGGEVIIPKHIKQKDNRLFLANYKLNSFDFEFDARAYRFDADSNFKLLDQKNNTILNRTPTGGQINFSNIDKTIDAVNPSNTHDINNPDFDKYIYKSNGTTIGATGPNVEVDLKYRNRNVSTLFQDYKNTGLKRGETYRIALQGQDVKGRWSFPKWICDFIIPGSNMTGYNSHTQFGSNQYVFPYLDVSVNNLPNSVIKWRVLIVPRNETDKTVITQGMVNATINNNNREGIEVVPSYFQRTLRDNAYIISADSATTSQDSGTTGRILTGTGFDPRSYGRPIRMNYASNAEALLTSSDLTKEGHATSTDNISLTRTWLTLNSPEILFNKSKLNIDASCKINVIGITKNNRSVSVVEVFRNIESNFNTKLFRRLTVSNTSALYLNYIDYVSSFLSNGTQVITPTFKTQTKFIPNNNLDSAHVDDGYRFRSNFYRREFDRISNTTTKRQYPFIENSVQYYSPPSLNVFNITQNLNLTKTYSPETRIILFKDIFSQNVGSLLFAAPGGLSNDGMLNSILAECKYSDNADDYGLIIEIVRDVSNQYGGKGYAARQRNTYIPYSLPVNPNQSSGDICWGDSYIQFFKVLTSATSPTTTEDVVSNVQEVCIYPVETSINLDMRYDDLAGYDGTQNFNQDSAHLFNNVYNQQNNLRQEVTKPLNFKIIEEYPSDIIGTFPKILGEEIDSWSKISVNDRLTLDTHHGPITALSKIKDIMLTYQRNAIAYLAINPRVQVTASDGIPIELGSGRLLERYQYLSTTSGSIHRHSIANTKQGQVYFDYLNKSINFIQGESELEVSTVQGLYNYLNKYLSENNIKVETPHNNKGVVTYYDNLTEDIYITFLGEQSNFTVAYNAIGQGFTSFYSFEPVSYINYNNKMLTSKDGLNFYEHNKGLYNFFYDEYNPSKITLVLNPDAQASKIFDKLSYMSDVYTTDNKNNPVNTITHCRFYNDYQDSGLIPLVNNQNIRRRFRHWYFNVPRNAGTIDRIRSPWVKCELHFNNPSQDFLFTLHDLILSYTL